MAGSSPRIAAAGEWGRPSDAGPQLSALAIPAACRGVADVLATDEALGGGADAARPGAAESARVDHSPISMLHRAIGKWISVVSGV
ncbi:MAG: hypothetical protein R3B96_04795 [Pirellulaceae bacterium]